jgi:chromosome segregation ATPase
MLEKLIESQLLLPLIAVGSMVLAVAFFKLGWSFKAFGARRRETALQKDIRDAKTSVPQLESNIRSREQLIVRLQDDLQAQKDRIGQIQGEQTERERQLKSVQTELRHLTSELSAIKGKSTDSRDIDLDSFNNDVTSAAEDLSPLVAKLKVAEQLYDKMKAAVIERSARIEVLERLLKEAESGILSGEAAMRSNPEIDSLRRQLEHANRSIFELNAQVVQLKREKDMVEELAQKRSKANRSLKDSKSDVEARRIELEQAVETHQKTISDRELSIHRLLSEVQVIRKNLRDSVEEAHRLMRVNQAKDEALTEANETQRALEQAISQRDAKVMALQVELDKANHSLVLLQQENRVSLSEGEARRPAPGDLEAELEARHRAHQQDDAVGRREPSPVIRLAPPDDLRSQPVAGTRIET